MSSSARFAPTDIVLPFLAVALDANAMQHVLEQYLRTRKGNAMEVTACEIERVKYRPQRNCMVGYKLTLRDADGEHEQRLCAGTFAPEDAAARYEKASSEESITSLVFPPVTLIRPLNMVVWAFPNERKLKTLPLLADPERLRDNLMPDVVQSRWGEGWEIANCSSAISNYFPEHSCCVNVTLTLRHPASGARRVWEVIGKNRYDDAGAQTQRFMAALWANVSDEVSFARPILYQSEQRLLWQERVAGSTLHSLLSQRVNNDALLVRVARAIAALHGMTIETPRRVTLADLIDRLVASRKVIAAVRPSCAGVLRQTTDMLLGNTARLNVSRDGVWHGDLHSKNILVSPTQICLVDMDGVSVGTPLAELGSFLAELIYRQCLDGEPIEALFPTLETVVGTYRQYVSWPVPMSDVAWFTARALIAERAQRCVTSLKPGRTNMIENLITAASHIARRGSFTHSPTPVKGVDHRLHQVV
jgi:Phosphotransferase enzyme family